MPSDTPLLYRASGALVEAPVVWVERDDGRPIATVVRIDSGDRGSGWTFFGGGVPDFVIEDEGHLDSFLVTRPDRAPFGRIEKRGRLRPRLEASDSRGRQLVIEADGQVFSRHHHVLGRILLTGPGEAQVRVTEPACPTQRTLLLASPICHAVQQALLRG